MDDLRVLWMRDRVYTAFDLNDPKLFEDLLNRNDSEAEDLILHFLNASSDEDNASALFFYRVQVPEEVEVEIGEQELRPAYSQHPADVSRAVCGSGGGGVLLFPAVLCGALSSSQPCRVAHLPGGGGPGVLVPRSEPAGSGELRLPCLAPYSKKRQQAKALPDCSPGSLETEAGSLENHSKFEDHPNSK